MRAGRRATRSIPACAGEPSGSVMMKRQPRVYPRVCGGTDEDYWYRHLYPGLSPRVRGNHHREGRRVCYRRSIPACAGEPVFRLVQTARS